MSHTTQTELTKALNRLHKATQKGLDVDKGEAFLGLLNSAGGCTEAVNGNADTLSDILMGFLSHQPALVKCMLDQISATPQYPEFITGLVMKLDPDKWDLPDGTKQVLSEGFAELAERFKTR